LSHDLSQARSQKFIMESECGGMGTEPQPPDVNGGMGRSKVSSRRKQGHLGAELPTFGERIFRHTCWLKFLF